MRVLHESPPKKKPMQHEIDNGRHHCLCSCKRPSSAIEVSLFHPMRPLVVCQKRPRRGLYRAQSHPPRTHGDETVHHCERSCNSPCVAVQSIKQKFPVTPERGQDQCTKSTQLNPRHSPPSRYALCRTNNIKTRSEQPDGCVCVCVCVYVQNCV